MKRGVLRLLLAGCLAMAGTHVHAEPRVIHEAPSKFGGSVVVTDDGDRLRSLRFGRHGDPQSTILVGDPDYLHLQYARVVLAGLALVDTPRRILVVGLGGASLPVFLRKHYPETKIDVVEIDPSVVAAAKLYFAFKEDGQMRAHVADGRAFIEKGGQAPYDVIVLDAYGSDSTPPHLATLEFLQAVRKRTTSNGVVISSFWTRGKNSKYDAMVRTYQEAFEGIYLIEAPEKANHVLFALQRPKPLDRAAFAAAAKRIATDKGFRFDLGALVNRGYLEPPAPDPRLAALRDAPKSRPQK